MKTDWYWEYIIKIFDEDNAKEEIISGVTYADSFTEAVSALDEYYGSEMMEIQMLKAIAEGPVFDFAIAQESSFDFDIIKKIGV